MFKTLVKEEMTGRNDKEWVYREQGIYVVEEEELCCYTERIVAMSGAVSFTIPHDARK